MKITRTQLKRIIREEKRKLLKESFEQGEIEASRVLESLLDFYIDEALAQGRDNPTAEDETFAFDAGMQKVEKFFQQWVGSLYDRQDQGGWE